MKGGYWALSNVYDRLNKDIDYSSWAEFIENCFSKFMRHMPSLLLELGCGTGSMTLELASRGYDMTALDISPDMLSLAYNRAFEANLNTILFLEEDMCSFELYGTVDAVICCLDGINHILSREDLKKCFSLVHNYLESDGVFIFDVNTPYKFFNIYADNDYILEEDGAVCVWRNRLSEGKEFCDFHLTVFDKQKDGRYIRRDGLQSERCYTREVLEEALSTSGFDSVEFFSDFKFSPPTEKSERWYIVAKPSK